jgi:autotransporter-associated beta strand protein
VDSGFIDLVVTTGPVGPANLTWNNATANNLWDTNTSANWNSGTGNSVFHAADNVTFNDNNGGAGNYAVTLNTTVLPGSVTVANSSGNYSISGTGSIAGTASLTKSGTGTLTLSTPNTFTGGVNVSAGTLLISRTSATTSALPKGALSITGGVVELATNVTLGSQSTSPAAPTSNVHLTSLSITGTGQFDINNNHIIIDYTPGNDPIASIAAMIASGFTNGAWTGDGIISTAAAANKSYGIGYADAADAGNPAGLSSGEIEIMYTLLGDANLDGKVNGTDFAILASNFNQSVTGWDKGDFNYDNKANGIDFTELAANFNQGASQSADESALQAFAVANGLSTTSVPEPASTGLIALGVMSVLSRRRRKSRAN